jgi:type I restriction enzyme M protein
VNTEIKQRTIALIDALKSTCQSYGLGNDGNEYKIITQVFLYKFLNDKFGYEIKKLRPEIAEADSWEIAYASMSENDRLDLLDELSPDVPRLQPHHLISHLWNQQTKGDFELIFDSTMVDIADENIAIFSTQTTEKTKIPLFEKLTNYVTDDAQRAPFARALVDKLVNFSFEEAFSEHYDFFAAIFEYLIKDYNTAGGGKYAEYYTPHAIATIMARLLVGDGANLHDVEIYDPSAGTGTLLMALSHQIGEDKCTIFAQDISQRSNKMLKLNLILNGLVSSLDHAIQGDTLLNPYHRSDDQTELRQFDYVVSNPPFKMDFSETRDKLAAMSTRFWGGVPKIPAKKKAGMAIYSLFIQHVVNSLKLDGKGAIVVPTGFLTAKTGVEKAVLHKLVDDRIISGAVSMPSNVFANTGTNVSVLFFDKSTTSENVVLIDASRLGEEYKEGTIQKRRLRPHEIELIVDTFQNRASKDEFSACVSYDEIKSRSYSLAAGQYFKVKLDHVEISDYEFERKMDEHLVALEKLFERSASLQREILSGIRELKHE